MTATNVGLAFTRLDDAVDDRVARAACRLYDAEVALHIARQTHVDAWVAAAYDRLHTAILEHGVALAAQSDREPAPALAGALTAARGQARA